MIREDMEKLVNRYLEEIIRYKEELAGVDLSKIEKSKEAAEKTEMSNTKLKKYEDILQLPLYSEKISYLAYPLAIRKPGVINRKELRKNLEEAGVETRPLFGCIPTQQPAYGHLKEEYKGKLPNADYIGKNGFYIGCHQYLEEEELEYISEVFKKILKQVKG